MATAPILARPPYRKRDVPRAYEHGWFTVELGKIQRAILTSTITRVTTFYTAKATDRYILCDCTSAAVVVGLPAASREQGLELIIKKIAGPSPATIVGTVDGVVDPVLTNINDSMTIFSDGQRWLKSASIP